MPDTLKIETVPIERLFCSPANPRINDPAVPHVAAAIAAPTPGDETGASFIIGPARILVTSAGGRSSSD